MSKVVPIQRGRPRRRVWTQDTALAAEVVDLTGVAAIAGVTEQAARKWRTAYRKELELAELEGREPVLDENCLVKPLDELTLGGIWRPADVVQWLRDTKRMRLDSYVRIVKPGSGRPKKEDAQAAA